MNNQTNPKQILLQTLDIIEYQNDKNAFSDEFMVLCQQEAFAKILEDLPEDKRKQFASKLINKEKLSNEKAKELIEQYFSKEHLLQTLQEATNNQFHNFIEEIEPTLSTEQIDKLEQYFETLRNNNSSL